MTSSTDLAYHHIRQRILNGSYEPGARLKEDEIARSLGISRTPVRDALRRLSGEGIVLFALNQGARVSSWTADDMEEITALRATLESFAAELAATKIDEEGIARLKEIQSAMTACVEATDPPDIEGVAKHNNDFHQAIVDIAGNTRLRVALQQVTNMPLILRKFAAFSFERLQHSLTHHRDIIAALEIGDPAWAASAMRSHILAARDYDAKLVAQVQPDEDRTDAPKQNRSRRVIGAGVR